ncbi:hypothetical protein LTR04_001424, partial [Oleoguttula sp. CCFEE 6159]
MAEERSRSQKFYNYPEPRAFDVPYKPPPPPANPVVRGLPLYFGASLVSSVSSIQNLLWSNAGFSGLRGLPELEDIAPRYDPTVIPVQDSSTSVQKNTDRRSLRQPTQRDTPLSGRYNSVWEFHGAYNSGYLTPSTVVEALLPLIRRDLKVPTKHSKAFLDTKVELVRAAAAASTLRYRNKRSLGILDGVPVAVKDEVDLKGYGRCLGSKRNLKSKEDATSWCVKQWEEEGAIVLGKLNMHELGLDTTNNNPNYGTPLNPHNEHYYTGGSSGGSAYAVAAGLIPIALGADGGGSIRIPSAYCGIYGLKTSHGRVSARPTPSLANTTGVVGPMASNMADLEIAYRVMAVPDPDDPSSALFLPPHTPDAPSKKVIGIYQTWFDRADAPVRAACQLALDYMEAKLGYEIVDITIPMIHEGQTAHAMTILAEISSSFLISLVSPQQTKSSSPSAQKVRNLLMMHLASLFRQHPGMVIVTPTTPNAGWHISGGKGDLKYGVSDGNMSVRNMEYVWLANFTGLPSLSLPVGYADPVQGEGKIPIGLMGMAEWGSDDALI